MNSISTYHNEHFQQSTIIFLVSLVIIQTADTFCCNYLGGGFVSSELDCTVPSYLTNILHHCGALNKLCSSDAQSGPSTNPGATDCSPWLLLDSQSLPTSTLKAAPTLKKKKKLLAHLIQINVLFSGVLSFILGCTEKSSLTQYNIIINSKNSYVFYLQLLQNYYSYITVQC